MNELRFSPENKGFHRAASRQKLEQFVCHKNGFPGIFELAPIVVGIKTD